MNEVLQAIRDRRSIRAYTEELVTDEQLNTLIETVKQAPSTRNLQPCHFTFVKDQVLLREFSSDMNALYQKNPNASEYLKSPEYDVLYRAPLVCFIFSEISASFTPIDGGIAVQTLALAAHSMGLGSVILGMPKELFASEYAEKWFKKLNAPEGGDFIIAISIGTPAAGKDAHPVREGLISII
ncbi:MAG: nitroreductase family protein [Clostridia bacterium]|nr:nitroreductase family protein [Clostridia bacterium]